MGSLQWQAVPDETVSKIKPASMQPRVVSSSNPWFGISVGLIGLIVGYIIANVLY